MRKGLSIALFSLWLSSPAAAQGTTQITVYTAVAPEEINRIDRAFTVTHKNVALAWVRDSTERILARLRAEQRQPKADVVWMVAASGLAGLAAEGYFQPYAPKGFDRLRRGFSDPVDPPRWIGQRAWAGALCVNPEMLKAEGLKPPARWGDLLDPALRGKVAALDPAASRTGLAHVAGWLALWGDAGAWRYMEGLHRNVAAYFRAGATPCDLVARGMYPVGISYAYRAAKLMGKGKPLAVVLPGDGVGWDVEATAIVSGTPYLEAARAFVDWTVGSEAMTLQARGFGLTAHSTVQPKRRFYPEKMAEALVPLEFNSVAARHDRMIAQWRLRFGAKSEPGG